MTQAMEMHGGKPCIAQNLGKTVLHGARLDRLLAAGQDVFFGFSRILPEHRHHARRDRNFSDRFAAFRRGNDQLCAFFAVRGLDALHRLSDGENPFLQINVLPLERTQLSDADTCVHGKRDPKRRMARICRKMGF